METCFLELLSSQLQKTTKSRLCKIAKRNQKLASMCDGYFNCHLDTPNQLEENLNAVLSRSGWLESGGSTNSWTT